MVGVPRPALLAGSAFSGDDDGAHAEVVQGVIDVLLAVAAVGGHGPRRAAGPGADAACRWGRAGGVGRVAVLDIVVEDDAVLVVDQLGFVAELHRFAEAAFRDRAGVRVGQAAPPGA